MEGYTSVDGDGIPVAVLKLRLTPNRHVKEAAGTFRAQTPQGDRDVRVIVRIEVYPEFWTEPEDVRMLTLPRGERERTITLVGATATESDFGDASITLQPLPSEMTLVSSTSQREKHDNLWINKTESVLKYTSPSGAEGMRTTRIVWKTPNTEYERSVYWTTTKGVACRPSHLFIKPTAIDKRAASWSGDILLTSAFEDIRVTSVSCPEAEVTFNCASEFMERQQKVTLSIALKDSQSTRLKLIVKVESPDNETTEISLPVYVSGVGELANRTMQVPPPLLKAP